MTSSQPPTPGGYGPPPHGGQPGYPPPYGGQPGYPPPQGGQPGYPPQGGQPGYPPQGSPPGGYPPPQSVGPGYPPPPGGQPGYPPPAPGHQPGPPPGYGPPPGSADPHGRPAGTGGGFDVKKLRMADYVVVGGMIVYLVMALLPWVDVAHFLGVDLPGVDTSVNGFQFSGLVTFSFVLFLLAAAWALLPAFTDVKVGFPRAWITVGLAALGFVLTLIAWIRSLTYGFEIWALIGLLAAAAIAVFALLGLLPELHSGSALSGRLGGAAQWANQQAPDLPRQFGSGAPPRASQPTTPPPPPPYGQPVQQPGQPPQYGQPAGPAQGAPGARIPSHGMPEPGIPGHGMPEPGIPGGGVPRPGEPGAPSTPPYGPPSGDTAASESHPGGSTASGQTPPGTPGGPSDTSGDGARRPGDPD